MGTLVTVERGSAPRIAVTVERALGSVRGAVVLLHGGGQTRGAWGGLPRRLSSIGYDAYALDLRGHGDSGWDPEGDYSFAAMAGDVRRVARTIIGAPATLVGASLGGLVALGLAADEAIRTTGLVLVDVVPEANSEAVSHIEGFMTAHDDGFASLEAAAEAVAAYLPHRPRPETHSSLLRNLRRTPEGRLRWHWDPRLLAGDQSWPSRHREELKAAASRVTVPTLLVLGALSDVVDAHGLAAFRGQVPQLRVERVEGAHHMVAGDQNDAFADVIASFVDDIHAPAG